MSPRIPITVFFVFSFFLAHSQNWKLKIDASIQQEVAEGKEVEFLIVLTEQADLSEAAFFTRKEEKGEYVFQQLTKVAERTQGNVLEIMEEHEAPSRSFWILNAVWGKGGIELLKALAELPEVDEIHANPVIHFAEPMKVESGPSRVVEWGISNIDADDVWALGHTGSGVVVGGQDTGYDWDVPAIKLKYRGWNNATMSADHNYNWHDAIHTNAGSNPCGTNSPEPCDDHNHGTHTMGTMVGADGADEIGVAPDAKWMGCRNMDEGTGTPVTYIECFEWFLAPTDLNDLNPNAAMAPHVINNSWSCPTSEGCNTGNFADMEMAVNNLVTAGVVVVVSAGNSGSGCSTVNAPPAIFDGSLSVGASNISNGIAGFSSRGPVTVNGSNLMKPNVSAPGVGVRSCIRNGNYATWNGTSMAGPHVAGIVALMISANPNLAGQVSQIENIIENTSGGQTTNDGCGGDPPTASPNNTFGHGISNALGAVNSALALLPIELIRFSGLVKNESVLLEWETAIGGSLNHFEIEHSADGQNWEVITKKIFAHDISNYQFLDERPIIGQNYYRLKNIDLDGNFEYSKTISLSLSRKGGLSLFPNPVKNELRLISDWGEGENSIFIFDTKGRLMAEYLEFNISEPTSINIDVSELPSGIYFVKILNGNKSGVFYQNKFVKL